MHMGFSDNRRFPDFSYLSKTGDFNGVLDCIIISHFHLDHCGALPYFTEICGFDGPIYMTTPTRAIAPILLDDMRKVVTERKGDTSFFTSSEIRACLKKVIPVSLHETIQVDDDLSIKPYYAGHVLGAAMFHIKVGDLSAVYTGDYNMTPDRHLGAAWIDDCKPDLLITETTYATTTRASKRTRELDFLQQVHDCVLKGGKVLIPVFALGRAQELCILMDSYWAQTGLTAPVYYSAGLTERANQYYKLFIGWTNEKIKSGFSGSEADSSHNMFDFKHIKPFDRTYADDPGPMVLFASPGIFKTRFLFPSHQHNPLIHQGMLHAGQSLDVFKKWCHDPKNMIILPGYCVAGTVGAKVLAGDKVIDVDKVTKLNVNLQVKNLSFSAHADSKGILQLIGMCQPKNVMLVHGEARKMAVLKTRIHKETGIPTFDPPNGTTITIACQEYVHAVMSEDAVHRIQRQQHEQAKMHGAPAVEVPFTGVVVMKEGEKYPRVMDAEEVKSRMGMEGIAVGLRVRKTFDAGEMMARHQARIQQQQQQQQQQGNQKRKALHNQDVYRVVFGVVANAVRQFFGAEERQRVRLVAGESKLWVDDVVGIRVVGGDAGEEDSVVVEWGDARDREVAVSVVAVVSAALL
ncbi:Integrator complex subunit 11 [Podochytrium sp. JEL0797]|nr:Integrator complex subunit 11 [Podochytrium sp. JEL0797]